MLAPLLLAVAAACAPTVYPPYGTYVATPKLHGPGLVLAGGGGLDEGGVYGWMRDRTAGHGPARAGNVVVLRASGTRDDDEDLYAHSTFASVRTILIPPCATQAQTDAVVATVREADAVYFAGGDQANYVRWKGWALIDAVKSVYARGGVVGGRSAGLAIQGAAIYDSVAGDRLDVETHTADAVKDPLEARISFTTGFFAWPPLSGTITDTHLVTRDRIGRTIVFLARMRHDGTLGGATTLYAIGVDEGSAVVVDGDGRARVFAGTGKGAYLIRATAAPNLSHAPIRYTVEIAHLRDGVRFDLLHKSVPVRWRTVTVDGTRTPVYSRNPYEP